MVGRLWAYKVSSIFQIIAVSNETGAIIIEDQDSGNAHILPEMTQDSGSKLGDEHQNSWLKMTAKVKVVEVD